MKKVLALAAIAATSLAANAASINWTVSGNTTTVLYGVEVSETGEASSSTTALKNTNVYFILAGGLDDVFKDVEKNDLNGFNTVLSSITLDTATTTENGTKPSVTRKVVSGDDRLTAATQYTFGLLVYDTDSDGNIWYKVATANQVAYVDGADARDQKVATLAFAKLANDTQAAWTAVPEPATAAMALLGIGMMLKRRKA